MRGVALIIDTDDSDDRQAAIDAWPDYDPNMFETSSIVNSVHNGDNQEFSVLNFSDLNEASINLYTAFIE